jgi:hypothetical protein
VLSAADRVAIRQLASDLPTLWHAPTTTVIERKEIIWQLVQRVVVRVQGQSERVLVTIEWVGGAQTRGIVVRPVQRFSQLSYYPTLCQVVLEGAAAGVSCTTLAQHLNQAGYRPPKRCARFTGPIVQDLLRHLQGRTRQAGAVLPDGPGPGEWYLADLARTIGMPPVTLYHWLRRGGVTGRQEGQAPGRWIIWAESAEVARLRELHARPAGYHTRGRWAEGSAAVPPDAQGTDRDAE